MDQHKLKDLLDGKEVSLTVRARPKHYMGPRSNMTLVFSNEDGDIIHLSIECVNERLSKIDDWMPKDDMLIPTPEETPRPSVEEGRPTIAASNIAADVDKFLAELDNYGLKALTREKRMRELD